MDHPLVVLTGSDRDEELVREAVQFADGADIRIEFPALFSSAEFEESVDTLETIADAERIEYEVDAIDHFARQPSTTQSAKQARRSTTTVPPESSTRATARRDSIDCVRQGL